METCVFCDEQEQGVNTFSETSLWRARWDLYPATPGHVEVTPKRHVQYLEQLTDEELNSMMSFARSVMAKIRDTNLPALYKDLLPATDESNRPLQEAVLCSLAQRSGVIDAFNFGINDGPEAGQSIHHLHLHLMPRWKGDIENPRGGVRNLFSADRYKDL